VSASTHKQALCAVLALYQQVLGGDRPWMREIDHPPVRLHIPVVLSRDELGRLLAARDGPCVPAARLLYGSGLRLLARPAASRVASPMRAALANAALTSAWLTTAVAVTGAPWITVATPAESPSATLFPPGSGRPAGAVPTGVHSTAAAARRAARRAAGRGPVRSAPGARPVRCGW
jgi:integrase